MAQIPLPVLAGLAVAIAISFAYRYFVRINAERRLRSMLEAVGIDPDVVDKDDIEETVSAMRARCQHCGDKRHCDRWLAGDEQGGNAFCPNREVFGMLRRYRRYSS